MKKFKFILPVFVLLFLMACANQNTSIDRALIFQSQYDSIESTYKNQYLLGTEVEKKWLKENVAPLIDELRMAVSTYTKYALIGQEDSITRLEIIQLYRQAVLKLAMEVTK